MENETEYILIKKITDKENRRNVIKIIAQAFAFVGLAFASMYMFLYFILWADEISDKIVGLF
jgi:hypothetical protein